jgi:hypothetical protein
MSLLANVFSEIQVQNVAENPTKFSEFSATSSRREPASNDQRLEDANQAGAQ